MKKFGNVVLTIVMLCLIMLLCVNLSIKTMSTKAITNAVVVQEASNGIEEVLNQAFPDVSNENIKKVEEAVKNNSALNDVTSDLLDQITAAVAMVVMLILLRLLHNYLKLLMKIFLQSKKQLVKNHYRAA